MTTAATEYAPLAQWMRYRDSRVNDLLQIADYWTTFVTDEDMAQVYREVRALTFLPGEESLSNAAIDRLMAELVERVAEAQVLEDDGDAAREYHDVHVAIEQLRDQAAEIAGHVLTVAGHRQYALVVAA